MITKFPYNKINYEFYWNNYMQSDDAIKKLPNIDELKELAIKSIVKDHLILLPIDKEDSAKLGDTVTMSVSSELPKFNKPKITCSIGRGLYNKDLENMIIGKKVFDSFSIIIQDKNVDVKILEIKRKSLPEPTDEMVVAMGAKDNENKLITTVQDYVKFIIEEKKISSIANINYYIMEKILADYPISVYDESDIKTLGELESEMFIKLFKEQEGLDLTKEIPNSWKEDMGINSLEEFINSRYEWYKMKIQQCHIYANILDVELIGKNDPLDHYEVLSELQMKMFEMIENKLNA